MTIEESELVNMMKTGQPITMPVIDIHAHLGDYCAMYTPNADARGMVEEMDRVGVNVAAISTIAALSADYVAGNDLAAAAAREFPGRFLGYASVNPHYGDLSTDELTRCFDEHGFRLIKIHPGLHVYPLTGKAYECVYEFAARRNAPVLTHTWDGDKTCSPEVAAEAARRYPEVKFLWGHSGAPNWRAAADLACELPNVFLELACSQVVLGQVEYFLTRMPAERVLFGSDFPFLSLPQQVAKVVFADISETDKRKILHENAARLLAEAGVTAP